MKPTHHLFLGVLFALFLISLFPQIGWIGFLMIVLSTVLIDVDHYLYYVYKRKNYNLKNAYEWYIQNRKKLHLLSRKQRNKVYPGFFFLHGIEILFILSLLWGFVSEYFFFIFIGFAFHLLLDIVDQTTCWDRIDRVSLIYDFLKFKKLKKIKKHVKK